MQLESKFGLDGVPVTVAPIATVVAARQH